MGSVGATGGIEDRAHAFHRGRVYGRSKVSLDGVSGQPIRPPANPRLHCRIALKKRRR